MKRILITKDVAYGAKIGGGTIASASEVNQLVDGALAIFSEAGVLIPIAALATTLNDVKNVYFAVGTGSATTGARLSQPIEREYASVTKKVYAASTLQKQFIGEDSGGLGDLNLPGTLAAGDEMTVKIIDITKGRMPAVAQESFTYRLTASDTAGTAITNLIAMMTNTLTGSKLATVAVVGAQVGISVESKNVGQILAIALDGILKDATIEKDGAGASVNAYTGQGTNSQISALEDHNDVEEGNTNQIHFANKYFNRAKRVASGVNYDSYHIQYEQRHRTPTSIKHAGVWDLVIAIPTAAATFSVANFETALTAIFGIGTMTANQTVEAV